MNEVQYFSIVDSSLMSFSRGNVTEAQNMTKTAGQDLYKGWYPIVESVNQKSPVAHFGGTQFTDM